MVDSHLQHPGIRLWVSIVSALVALKVPPNLRDPAVGHVNQVLRAVRNEADALVVEANVALDEMERNLNGSVTDPRRLTPHRQLLERLKAVLAPGSLALDWHNYRQRVISADMVASLGLLDADLSGSVLTPTDLVMITQEVQKLQQKVEKTNLSPSWTSLLTAQLDLIERAVARVNADGFANFNEVVFCAVGRLEVELKIGKFNDDADVVRGIVDDVLRVAGLAQLGAGGVALLPFFGSIAGLLTGPVAQ